MSDRVSELASQVAEFAAERGWNRFHTPRNVATALSVEVSELLELFQWNLSNESNVPEGSEQAIAGEVADIAIYLLTFCNVVGLDLGAVVADKLATNSRRYPANPYDGPWRPRDRT